jgi:hypothetical protein
MFCDVRIGFQHARAQIQNPSPVSPKGEKPFAPKTNIGLEIQQPRQPGKEDNSMPSPLGEGQTDMPINYLHQGEVRPRSTHPTARTG